MTELKLVGSYGQKRQKEATAFGYYMDQKSRTISLLGVKKVRLACITTKFITGPSYNSGGFSNFLMKPHHLFHSSPFDLVHLRVFHHSWKHGKMWQFSTIDEVDQWQRLYPICTLIEMRTLGIQINVFLERNEYISRAALLARKPSIHGVSGIV
jgi:hypothetical protein